MPEAGRGGGYFRRADTEFPGGGGKFHFHCQFVVAGSFRYLHFIKAVARIIGRAFQNRERVEIAVVEMGDLSAVVEKAQFQGDPGIGRTGKLAEKE